MTKLLLEMSLQSRMRVRAWFLTWVHALKCFILGGADTVSVDRARIGYRVRLIIPKSVSTIQTFFLAMVLYPEVQRRAQKEIDNLVGTDRLPEFRDLASMPYILALLKELLRWQPVAPLGRCYIHRIQNPWN